jgi:lichenan operon transcriptional antiterminator
MNQRLLSLFKLLNENNDYIPSKMLSSKLKVSERTIRSDISTLNSILNAYGASIKMKKGSGYHIDISDLSLYQNYLAELSKELIDDNEIPDSPLERNKYIIKYLLNNKEYIKVEDLADMLYVSKVTVINDLKRVKSNLSKYNLTLVSKPYYGIKVSGKEIDIRRCFSSDMINRNFDNYIIGITNEEIELFRDIDLIDLYSFILNEIDEDDITFSDFNLKNFIIHIAISTTRILNGYIMNNDENIVFTNFKQNRTLENIYDYLESKYNISINKAEKLYIYNHFTSKSVPSNNNFENFDDRIVEHVNELLLEIYNSYNFDLRNDSILFNDLLLHFKSILNSKYYNLSKSNPLINMIKSNYPLAFEISLTAVEKVFSKTMYTLTEDEVGYLSLHIGAAIERLFEETDTPKNIAIICGSGYGSSRLLEAKLHKIFQNKINIVACLSYNDFNKNNLNNIDLIISTVPVKHKVIPVILVNLALLNKDIENISKAISSEQISKFIGINSFFDDKLFIHHPSVKDKKDLINLMCTKLLENGFVASNFNESVLTRESLSSTDIESFLAIPHPLELSATQTKICVAILKEPIQWSDEGYIQFVLMLAINRDDSDKIDSLYELFLNIIQDANLKNEICDCENYNDFMNKIISI